MKKLINVGGTEKQWGENLTRTMDSSSKGIILHVDKSKAVKPFVPKNMMPRLIRFLDLHPQEGKFNYKK